MPRKPVDKFVDKVGPNGNVMRVYSQVSEKTWNEHFAPKNGPVGMSINSTRTDPSPVPVPDPDAD